jgi:glycosyltransferase involved in cell wall biosynthesis
LVSLANLDYPKDRLELLVVDNMSTDRTREIASRFPVTVLSQDRTRSSYATRNAGIRHAQGEIIAFTDSDCVVARGWLRNLVQGFEDPSVGCFAGEIVPYALETVGDRYLHDIGHMSHKDLLAYAPLPRAMTANLALRSEVFRRIGTFNGDLLSGGDSEMVIRMVTATAWKIRYNGAAVVFHKHRTRLWPFIRQFVRYGWGEAWLVTAYAEHVHPRISNGLRQEVGEICRGIGTFLRRAARPSGGDRVWRYGPLLNAIRLTAWNIGLRSGLLYRMYLKP